MLSMARLGMPSVARLGMPSMARLGLTLAIGLIAPACSSPTGPTTSAASINCPAVPLVFSPSGSPVPVNYPLPTVQTAAASSVPVTCAPQSGSAFSLGNTTVTCQTPQPAAVTASCAFTVTVERTPQIAYTRYLAFGDSITEGKVSEPIAGNAMLTQTLGLLDLQTRLMVLEARLSASFETYPQRLERLLAETYPTSKFSVTNAGVGGEYAAGATPSGVTRLPQAMQSTNPEVVLLMEGTNDLLNASGADAAIAALDSMVTQALIQGRRVCLATIPPQRSGGLANRGLVASRIPPFNDRVRALAASRGVTLVEVFAPINADIPHLIGIDDLHPTERGYAVIGDTFFAGVRAAFQQTSTGQTPK
jgi:lysophospholipase L1-like esterase